MRQLAFAIFAVFTVSWFAAVGFGAEVVDLANRTVVVDDDVERIICLGPGCLRLICYLNAQGKVVGVESMEKRFPTGRPYRLAHPDLTKLPVIATGGAAGIGKEPDLEMVLRVKPQVIFACYLPAATADKLSDKLGIPVVILGYGDGLGTMDEHVAKSLRLVGAILGKRRRAEDVVRFIQKTIDDLASRQPDETKRKSSRAYVGGLGYRGSHGLESSRADYPPFTWSGAVNAVGDLRPDRPVFTNKERLLAIDPEVVFIDAAGEGIFRSDYQRKKSYYQKLKAFKDGRVFRLLPFNYYATNVGTALIDAYVVGAILFPENYRDMDLLKKADEIYEFLLGKPLYGQMEKDFGVPERIRIKEQ